MKDFQKKKRKTKKQKYGWERYKDFSDEEKQKPVEHRKKYYKIEKNTLL